MRLPINMPRMSLKRASHRVVLKVQEVAVVVVTKLVALSSIKASFCHVLSACLIFFSFISHGAVLDDDKADILYHSYEGGGMKIDGPALLIRKKASESVAVSAFYYVDTISSASVDVMSTASPYTEERKEGQLGIEYLHDKTIVSVSIGKSDENDYLAHSISVNISHDTFGDLTNVNLGLSYGDDDVMRNGDENFKAESKHYRIRAGLSQILTRNLTASINIEGVSDEGFLNNPYRTVRYVDNSLPSGVAYQAEVYPNTRNSFAIKLSASYYLPYKAALFSHYRYFNDSWDISAQDFELGYRHPFGDHLELELKVRSYQQSQASFYSDLFSHRDAQNFLARDKELSEFDDFTLGFGLTYKLPAYLFPENISSEATIQWDRIKFDYHNFRDPTANAAVGEEPLYGFSADVIRAFFSVYF